MPKNLSIFFIADIVGEPGLNILETMFPPLRQKYSPDFIIANAENSHEGRGLNRDIVKRLYDIGVNVITGGNHSFDKWKIFSYMKNDEKLLRPMNYPKGNAGYGYGVYPVEGSELKVGVLNLQGRTFMPQIDDPFTTSDWALERIKKETDIVFVDFHAEATAEKLAYAWNVDGTVSAIVGTHTHVPTNDARIFPKGTGYITDAGMTGPFDSVIGMDKGTSIRRFTLGTPQKYKIATDDNRICGVYLEVDPETAKCVSIEPVIFPDFPNKT
ncbi:MAG: TIGR00282 family metallophosphoesterase [Balneolaceae bacterium]|nr:TIGR00282 family metallophosphoesterase [Balneolaceae bacterium]MCH8549847.1 TIGR00282 family metallophosphoesterase [Balneolaceae bacterium]